ncbi:spectrin beta chain, non-erythrocytic 4 [Platysternon megacephalum]|uniref:Spectrin beta chain, non-erythrocytic 4 n=1 Tax=Platysternon megacephalum TaxID=55544 RepID=A0A4D9DS33_9SAUR|nr:spectrin beta chain, non-erythrocytic 4 [Platysternon megacephalum]
MPRSGANAGAQRGSGRAAPQHSRFLEEITPAPRSHGTDKICPEELTDANQAGGGRGGSSMCRTPVKRATSGGGKVLKFSGSLPPISGVSAALPPPRVLWGTH